ncbi:MAG: SUMF1/EgtB/PvdO family nonheme iron enzyme [Kofleriaceae bacterium]|nr:SUMF1/EgtB/PvdO family nonheme iron enzyme [Kofleriaceae bacterium]MCB9571075.1 SUMF1/EgtB/PvdO family nonheme iron enzyme [Kofleriaceae bacterium]
MGAPRFAWLVSICAGGAAAGCGAGAAAPHVTAPDPDVPAVAYRGHDASISTAADAQLVTIPGGRYVAGSTPEERAAAYDAYLTTSGADTARERAWFAKEEDRHVAELPTFRIDLMPVTNAAYAEFVADGGAPAPTMDEATWRAQGFSQRWPDEVERYVWLDGAPPPGRADHPVVLITWAEAAAYCAWRGEVVGEPRRLPSAAEYEKAARGTEGLVYPWGNAFDAARLDSQVHGPRDTMPAGSFPDGRSPYGVLGLAGNVFEWTSTPWPPGADHAAARRTVKGSAWDDWGGVGRGASGHGRPRTARHVIVGFRCAADGAGA